MMKIQGRIGSRQTKAQTFGRRRAGANALHLREAEALHERERHCSNRSDVEVQNIEEERNLAECREYLARKATQPLHHQQQQERWAERHKPIEQGGRIIWSH